MVLPFVRDLFADVEKLPAFSRVASHLKEGTGRIRVSGLIPTAKALLLVLLQKAAGRPLIIVVADNRAAEDLVPVLQAFCELTGAADPESVVSLPNHDVLPFQNLSPHPEIQEERAVALWKIATGAASFVISPIAATALRLRSAEYYADLARTVRRGEVLNVDALLPHLNTVGYHSTDVVEMPGEYALRGGILDVYSPEAERPVRIEFFGDEVESIRKFDPATQRSSSPVDEALLLPLTETPVSEELLGAIHARLSGKRITGSEEIIEQAVRSGGVTVFPGWEFYAPVAGANHTVFDLLPRAAGADRRTGSAADRVRSCLVAHRTGAREQRRRQPGAAVGSVSCRRKTGGRSCWDCPGPISSISTSSAATIPRRRFHSTPSPRPASTARFPPCSKK